MGRMHAFSPTAASNDATVDGSSGSFALDTIQSVIGQALQPERKVDISLSSGCPAHYLSCLPLMTDRSGFPSARLLIALRQQTLLLSSSWAVFLVSVLPADSGRENLVSGYQNAGLGVLPSNSDRLF